MKTWNVRNTKLYQKLSPHLDPSPHSIYLGKLLVSCFLIGIVAGIGAIVFQILLEWCQYLFLEQTIPSLDRFDFFSSPFSHPKSYQWLLFIIPTIGGLLSGLLVFLIAPETAGHGTDGAISAYHFEKGKIRGRVPLIKMLASALTIGSGGSGGKEGPVGQMSAGIGSLLGSWLKVTQKERRILLISGMAAGIGATFRAPLASALFASEVLYRDMEFEHEILIPATISSIIAYSVFAIPYGFDPLFKIPALSFGNPLELLSYAVLAVFLSICAFFFIKFFEKTHDLFEKMPGPRYLRPALGGFLAGSVAYFISQETLGTSHKIMEKALLHSLDSNWLWLLLFFGIAKILTTSFTISSGGSGGVFGPSLVIGGTLGGFVGIFLQQYSPFMVLDPRSFVLVGMAAFFAAVANSPLSSVILVSEITGNYTLLVPAIWTCLLAFLLVRKSSLYTNQLKSHLHTPVHTGEFMEQILQNFSVAEYLRMEKDRQFFETFSPETPFRNMLNVFSHTDQTAFPIVDEKGILIGVVESKTLREMIQEQGLDFFVVAHDLAEMPRRVTPKTNMLQVIELLIGQHAEDIVVVEESDSNKMIGMITRRDFIDFYDREMILFLQEDQKESEKAEL